MCITRVLWLICGRRSLVWLALACLVAGAGAAEKKLAYIDLQPKANQKLDADFHDTAGNNLAALPKGEQTLEGVKFKIGEGLVHLAGAMLPDMPKKVEGIKVEKTFTKLHILHSTGWSAEDDTLIGEYTVHYDDKTKETIPIVYGKDVRDWWSESDSGDVTRGKVAWKGSNGATTAIRLFLMTWENPKPDKKVICIDYSSAVTAAAPFCVAMTVEEK